MAILAVFLEEAGNLGVESDWTVFPGLGDAANETTGDRRRRHGNGFVRQHFRQSLGQVAAAGARALDVDAELIVNAALIANHALGVENKCLRGPLGAKAVGDDVAGILQHWEWN
jgi:hypothetical protein